jgi:hypothetical protein
MLLAETAGAGFAETATVAATAAVVVVAHELEFTHRPMQGV